MQTGAACLVDGADCIKILSITGKGTFRVLDDGRVTFTPLATFAGGTVTATYRATDLWGRSGQGSVSVTVLLPAKPVVTASSTTVNYNTGASFMPFVSGTMIQTGSACLVDGDNCVTELTVAGKGTFDVLEDGSVTFIPLATFAGDLAWVTYRATDFWGQTGENTIAVTVSLPVAPIVSPVNVTVDYNTGTILVPLIESPTNFGVWPCLVSGNDCVSEVVVAGKGAFTVLEDGSVSFTPLPSFAGGIAWVTYRAYDLWGQYGQNTLSVNVALLAAPNVDVTRVTTDYNEPINVKPTVDTDKIDESRDCLVTRAGCVTHQEVAGKGSFDVQSDGSVTFTPLDTYGGGTICTTYRVYDIWGQHGQSQVCVTVLTPAAPVVDSLEQTIAYNSTTDVTPNVVGYKILGNQACIVSGLHCFRTFTVAGEGTFTVLEDGTLLFAPVDTFADDSVTVTYRAYDMWGQFGQNTVKVIVSLPDAPAVDPAEVTVDYNTVASVTPSVSGAHIQVSLACLVSGSTCVKQIVVTGKGTFNVLDDGSVTFTPLDTFAGDSVTATYRATDFKGQTGENTVLVHVRLPDAPVVTGDSDTVSYNTVSTLTPGVSGTKIQLSSACLIDGGSCVKQLVVVGKGTFRVLNSGYVTFTPLTTFAGTVSGITYCVSDLFEQTDCAELSVTVNEPAALVVAPKTVNVQYQTATTFAPTVTGLAIDYSTACVVDPVGSQCKTSVTVDAVGTWNVDTTNGHVTFTPADGYMGTSTIEYRVSNIFGNESSNIMTVNVSGTATLNGVVWLDLNHNGIQDAGEPVLAGILVTAGNTQPANVGPASTNSYSVRTDSDGRYSFEVVPGNYEVKAYLNSSYLYTSTSKDPDTKQVESTSTWVTTAAAVSNTANETNFAAGGNGAIDGTAVFTSGAAVPKATVSCIWSGFDGVLGTSDDVVITATADANGKFSLTGIPGGKFQCGGKDPKSGVAAATAVVTVKGTSNAKAKPVKTPVVLPIKVRGKFTFIVNNFAAGSPAVTKAIKDRITYFVKKYKMATMVSVEGFTQGPTVLKVDYKLSLDRAKNALAIIKSINAKIKLISIKNVQENKIGSSVRRVRITLYW